MEAWEKERGSSGKGRGGGRRRRGGLGSWILGRGVRGKGVGEAVVVGGE